ncbi:lectin subunit alpha-like [Stomoxys calcitrans]|uniref:lectin subunit alpha-like n=1 Tax=Stomoxys calcitrans TaxID=35570 RepID=UPI0027E22EF5|nr:lectin subunit alpha-like [Stomoxys calcitrans]
MDMTSLFKLEIVLLSGFLCGLAAAEPKWYTTSDGRRFLIDKEEKYNWFQASHECGRRNLQLLEIDSNEKNVLLMEDVLEKADIGDAYLWIGAIDEFSSSSNRDFYWTSSGRKMNFTHWMDGEPSTSDEHCVIMHGTCHNFLWDDRGCTSNWGFICEERYLDVGCKKDCKEEKNEAIKKYSELFISLLDDCSEFE